MTSFADATCNTIAELKVASLRKIEPQCMAYEHELNIIHAHHAKAKTARGIIMYKLRHPAMAGKAWRMQRAKI